jgi:hypothetical protein
MLDEGTHASNNNDPEVTRSSVPGIAVDACRVRINTSVLARINPIFIYDYDVVGNYFALDARKWHPEQPTVAEGTRGGSPHYQ